MINIRLSDITFSTQSIYTTSLPYQDFCLAIRNDSLAPCSILLTHVWCESGLFPSSSLESASSVGIRLSVEFSLFTDTRWLSGTLFDSARFARLKWVGLVPLVLTRICFLCCFAIFDCAELACISCDPVLTVRRGDHWANDFGNR